VPGCYLGDIFFKSFYLGFIFGFQLFMFVLFVNNMIVFNIYLGIFFFLGFIFVDRAYYLKKNIHPSAA